MAATGSVDVRSVEEPGRCARAHKGAEACRAVRTVHIRGAHTRGCRGGCRRAVLHRVEQAVDDGMDGVDPCCAVSIALGLYVGRRECVDGVDGGVVLTHAVRSASLGKAVV